MSEHVQAYHFVGATLRDGRPVPPDGEWLVHDEPAVLCESGLHASRRPWDALQYAPGAVLCLVEVADIAEEREEQLVAHRRRIVRRVDLTTDLRAFARQCARDVLHLWDAPEVVRRYLESGDETLREAAREAAREVAWDAFAVEWAVSSAASAAMVAAGASALEAAREAANAAARAVREVTWDSVWDDAKKAAASDESAASAAFRAGEAAWDAVRAAQGEQFDSLCRERLGVTEAV